jgi:pyridoxamine 5'-phosphate oxidase
MKKQDIANMRREYNSPSSADLKSGFAPVALSRHWYQQALRVVSVLRHEYRHGLVETKAPSNPFELFRHWFREAVRAKLLDPNAMTLVTVTSARKPAVRTVLLKDFDTRGFVFYTNYQSQKGRELIGRPYACLLFYWPTLVRQVRVDGKVEKVPAKESDAYFHSRPRGSQLSAWASDQSRTVPHREHLEKRMELFEKRFKGKPVPRPPHWGGFRLVPDKMEFWNGRPNRLHDRLRYIKVTSSRWRRERLAP